MPRKISSKSINLLHGALQVKCSSTLQELGTSYLNMIHRYEELKEMLFQRNKDGKLPEITSKDRDELLGLYQKLRQISKEAGEFYDMASECARLEKKLSQPESWKKGIALWPFDPDKQLKEYKSLKAQLKGPIDLRACSQLIDKIDRVDSELTNDKTDMERLQSYHPEKEGKNVFTLDLFMALEDFEAMTQQEKNAYQELHPKKTDMFYMELEKLRILTLTADDFAKMTPKEKAECQKVYEQVYPLYPTWCIRQLGLLKDGLSDKGRAELLNKAHKAEIAALNAEKKAKLAKEEAINAEKSNKKETEEEKQAYAIKVKKANEAYKTYLQKSKQAETYAGLAKKATKVETELRSCKRMLWDYVDHKGYTTFEDYEKNSQDPDEIIVDSGSAYLERRQKMEIMQKMKAGHSAPMSKPVQGTLDNKGSKVFYTIKK